MHELTSRSQPRTPSQDILIKDRWHKFFNLALQGLPLEINKIKTGNQEALMLCKHGSLASNWHDTLKAMIKVSTYITSILHDDLKGYISPP
jgi:hypothetical protein